MKLMVLDGNSLVNRAFFGIKLLTTKDGRYTNAIFGFQNILLNLLAAHKPDAVAVAWDERAPTFRHCHRQLFCLRLPDGAGDFVHSLYLHVHHGGRPADEVRPGGHLL